MLILKTQKRLIQISLRGLCFDNKFESTQHITLFVIVNFKDMLLF